MNDHDHEWITETLDNQTTHAYCNIRGCYEGLNYQEIETYLNSYEKLKKQNIKIKKELIGLLQLIDVELGLNQEGFERLNELKDLIKEN